MFYVDEFDEKNSNPIQIRSYLELMREFQKLGKPLVACRVGTLGLGFLAAGITSATSGIGSLTGFSENYLLKNRDFEYKPVKKYYIPDLLISLPVQMAQEILEDSRNIQLRCKCVYCKGSPRGLETKGKAHFLQVRTQEVAEIQRCNEKDRLPQFVEKVENAIRLCEIIRKQQVVNLKPSLFSHLKVWKEVFSSL